MENTNSFIKYLYLSFYLEFQQLIMDLRWLILLSIVLILSDLWFGCSVSKKRGVEIRKSRACRRTLNKFVDYTVYVLIGTTIGKALGEPYGLQATDVAIAIMAICCCFDIDSVYNHILELHGIEKKYSIWKILFLIVTGRIKTLGEAFHEIHEQYSNNKHPKKED